MARFISGKALLAAGLLVCGLFVVEIAFFESAPFVSKAAAALSAPGNWAGRKWGNVHDASALLLWVVVNLACYYALFIAAIRLRSKVAAKSTS
jgi:hypothetical protein